MIDETIDNYDDEVNSLKELYTAWKQGNPKKILEFSNDDMSIQENYTDEQKKLVEDYNKKVINDRNIEMTNKLIEYFNSDKNVFYMVGALHLVGDNGIAHLLETKGYNIIQVNK